MIAPGEWYFGLGVVKPFLDHVRNCRECAIGKGYGDPLKQDG